MTTQTISETAIRDAAYFLWLDEGQPQGRDQELWYRAVDALTAPTPKAAPVRKAAKPRAKAAAPKAASKAAAPKAKAAAPRKKAAKQA